MGPAGMRGEMRELGGKSECLKYRDPLLPELS